MKIFYCAFESIFDPVFDSQVLVFLKKINNRLELKSQSINLVVFGSIEDFFKEGYRQKRKFIRKFLNNRCFFSFKLPYFFKLPRFFKFGLFLNSIICLFDFFFVLRLKKSEKVLIHCRTEIGSYILLNVKKIFYKNIKVICDCRGIGSKEILYKNGIKNKNALSKEINRIERFARLNSDFIFCVSQTFKEYILQESNYNIKRIMVVPCCVDVNKFKYDSKLKREIRKEMGIKEDNFVILYSGSLNEWQLPRRMIEIFKIFRRVIKNSIFVILTKDMEEAYRLFNDSGLEKKSFIISFKPYHLINKYLLIGDIGLLIREDNDVNRVAFPVKFSEYLRCGVPVISSISSDVINLIRDYDLGFKLENFNDDEEIRKIAKKIKKNMVYIKSDEYKNKISNIIRKKVDWDYYINPVIKIYKDLLSNN